MKQLFYQATTLSRFILHRDRFRISAWIIMAALLTFSIALSFVSLYETEQSRQGVAETMRNPAMSAMVGQGYGLDNYTNGAMMAHQMLLLTAVTVAIFSILLVARHTRADEEIGRVEMIRALPSGRLAHLHATMITVCSANIVLAALIAIGLYGLNIDSIDLNGSLLYGSALGVTGIFFTAITAIFAQISESNRGTIGLSFAILGIAYLIRAIGDAGETIVSWFSPLGWILGSEVYVHNYWWPILLTLGVSIILFILAYYLNAKRDLFSSFFPSRPGKSHASPLLQSTLGLGWNLQRTTIIAWTIAMFMLGILYGSVLGDLDTFIADNDMMQEFLKTTEGFSLTDEFITLIMAVMAMIGTIPILSVIFKLRSEENNNRLEHMLSHPVSRTRLLGSYVVLAVLTSIVVQLFMAIGLWGAAIIVLEDAPAFGQLFTAAIIYLPAMWFVASLALVLIGFAPKYGSLVWFYLGYAFIVIYLGDLLQFPEWLGYLSPFQYIPEIPIESVTYSQISLLMLGVICLTVAGFIGYNKRDIHG